MYISWLDRQVVVLSAHIKIVLETHVYFINRVISKAYHQISNNKWDVMQIFINHEQTHRFLNQHDNANLGTSFICVQGFDLL